MKSEQQKSPLSKVGKIEKMNRNESARACVSYAHTTFHLQRKQAYNHISYRVIVCIFWIQVEQVSGWAKRLSEWVAVPNGIFHFKSHSLTMLCTLEHDNNIWWNDPTYIGYPGRMDAYTHAHMHLHSSGLCVCNVWVDRSVSTQCLTFIEMDHRIWNFISIQIGESRGLIPKFESKNRKTFVI